MLHIGWHRFTFLGFVSLHKLPFPHNQIFVVHLPETQKKQINSMTIHHFIDKSAPHKKPNRLQNEKKNATKFPAERSRHNTIHLV